MAAKFSFCHIAASNGPEIMMFGSKHMFMGSEMPLVIFWMFKNPKWPPYFKMAAIIAFKCLFFCRSATAAYTFE